MNEPKRTDLATQSERMLLVGVILRNSYIDPIDQLGELRNLARTAGADVVDEMICKRSKPHPGMYVGTGKAQEIADRAEANEVDVVVFDNDLTPAQIRDLEEVIDRKVLDRSELILDIFAAHAQTAESRLQVELAQLEYTYPRLRHMWTHLERIAGGGSGAAAVGGIGTRGPGEKQIEVDRRLAQQRVTRLKRELAEIDRRKVRQVRSRDRLPSACLVGYTNAGKSTLMNLMTGANVFVADQLFATLDTRTRKWEVSDGGEVLLSDTVGFVRNLPHHLVASFRATLEEAIWSDLLLHVADASSEAVVSEIEAVEGVLAELDVDHAEQLLVLNKIDRITDPTVRTVLANKYPRALFISAATGEGKAELLAEVSGRLLGKQMRVTLEAHCGNGKLMHMIAKHARIESQTFEGSLARIEATLPASRIDELKAFGKDLRIISGPDLV